MSTVGVRDLILGANSQNTLYRHMKLSRLRWLSHVLRMAKTHLPCHAVLYFASLSQSGRSHVKVRIWRGTVEWENLQRTSMKSVSRVFVVGVHSVFCSIRTAHPDWLAYLTIWPSLCPFALLPPTHATLRIDRSLPGTVRRRAITGNQWNSC